MSRYYVNKNEQSTGEHEVHKEGCSWFPSENIYLGDYPTCHGAVIKARDHYTNVDGCKHCCPDCHTK